MVEFAHPARSSRAMRPALRLDGELIYAPSDFRGAGAREGEMRDRIFGAL